jgi:uncharacterized protein (TIGR04255 family)
VGSALQEKVVGKLKKHYPHATELKNLGITIDSTGGHVGLEQPSSGYRLNTEDQADVVLVLPKNVAIARLAPYQGWPALIERAREVWKTWRRFTPHHPIARVGVRMINRIDVPVDDGPSFSVQTYLNFYPQVPAVSGAALSAFVMQVTIPTREPVWSATITSTLAPSPLLNHVSLLLDIDLFRTHDIATKESEFWPLVEQARSVKNEIFESCITGETRRLISQ